MFFTRKLFREGTYTPQGGAEQSPANLFGGVKDSELLLFIFFFNTNNFVKNVYPRKGYYTEYHSFERDYLFSACGSSGLMSYFFKASLTVV